MDTLENFEKSVTEEVNKMGAVIATALISHIEEISIVSILVSIIQRQMIQERIKEDEWQYRRQEMTLQALCR